MGERVKLSYSADERRATLRVEASVSLWRSIRRTCQDASEDETDLTGPSSLTIPWWVYLGIRDEVEASCRRHSVGIEIDNAASAMLKEADHRLAKYELARTGHSEDESDVVRRLIEIGFKRTLTDEQRRNVARLVTIAAGATFSVPGAGKTTEALAFFALKRVSGDRLLVICPKNAFAAWEEQLLNCLPGDEGFTRLRGGLSNIEKALQSNPKKILITYRQLLTVSHLIGDYLTEDTFVFLDESHHIKRGTEGAQGNAILSIAQLPKAKLIMTGTPMPNDIVDLVPQFRFLYPEIIADRDSVEAFIKPVYVRTTKAELDLPERKKEIKTISLKPAQWELYRLLKSEAARDADPRLGRLDRSTLRRVGRSALRLLQVATNPATLASLPFEHEDLLGEVLEEGDSPKLEYACYRARELAFEGRKSIIWSSFVQNVEIVAQRLQDLGAEYIHGGVDAGSEVEEGTRENKIKRFHDDDTCSVLVANPAACGEGISLHTVCHHAIYLDRNYNAAQFLQSEDRIHRLGSDHIKFIEIIQAPGTVDEAVDRRLNAKIDNMAQVLNDESLSVEPETVDLDAEGFNAADFEDFLRHLKNEDAV